MKEMDLCHCQSLSSCAGAPDVCAMPVLRAIEGLLSSSEEQATSLLGQPRPTSAGPFSVAR